jgi:hypothetical protein
LEFVETVSRRELEDYAILVQEAIDEHAGDIALGAAVRCVYEPLAVETMFTVGAHSMAETHHRVALVLGAIEPALPFSFQTETVTSAADNPKRLVAA